MTMGKHPQSFHGGVVWVDQPSTLSFQRRVELRCNNMQCVNFCWERFTEAGPKHKNTEISSVV